METPVAYVLTLRPGEVVGIPIDPIQGNNIEIRQETERMTDKALKATAKEDIIRIFPKKIGESGIQLVSLTPKTEGSIRRLYLNKYLKEDIDARATVDTLRQQYGSVLKIYKTQIPIAVKAAEISAAGQSVFAYDKGSKVAQAYADFTKEVLADGYL